MQVTRAVHAAIHMLRSKGTNGSSRGALPPERSLGDPQHFATFANNPVFHTQDCEHHDLECPDSPDLPCARSRDEESAVYMHSNPLFPLPGGSPASPAPASQTDAMQPTLPIAGQVQQPGQLPRGGRRAAGARSPPPTHGTAPPSWQQSAGRADALLMLAEAPFSVCSSPEQVPALGSPQLGQASWTDHQAPTQLVQPGCTLGRPHSGVAARLPPHDGSGNGWHHSDSAPRCAAPRQRPTAVEPWSPVQQRISGMDSLAKVARVSDSARSDIDLQADAVGPPRRVEHAGTGARIRKTTCSFTCVPKSSTQRTAQADPLDHGPPRAASGACALEPDPRLELKSAVVRAALQQAISDAQSFLPGADCGACVLETCHTIMYVSTTLRRPASTCRRIGE